MGLAAGAQTALHPGAERCYYTRASSQHKRPYRAVFIKI